MTATVTEQRSVSLEVTIEVGSPLPRGLFPHDPDEIDRIHVPPAADIGRKECMDWYEDYTIPSDTTAERDLTAIALEIATAQPQHGDPIYSPEEALDKARAFIHAGLVLWHEDDNAYHCVPFLAPGVRQERLASAVSELHYAYSKDMASRVSNLAADDQCGVIVDMRRGLLISYAADHTIISIDTITRK